MVHGRDLRDHGADEFLECSRSYQKMETNEGPCLVLGGPTARDDIPALCEQVHVLVAGCDADPVPCDVGGLDELDAMTVDVLARLQLTALRLGRRLGFRDVCGELVDLVEFLGLANVLPCAEALGLEPRGQPEEREQALRVREEADSPTRSRAGAPRERAPSPWAFRVAVGLDS